MEIDHTAAVNRLIRFFETLTLQSIANLGEFYVSTAYFKDPFNEVRNVNQIAGIFTHMFTQVDAPRFEVTATIVQGHQVFLAWNFHFHLKHRQHDAQQIRGATHLRLAADGRVAYHRDYWDAAEELYEKLPVLGTLMRFLRRRASAAR